MYLSVARENAYGDAKILLRTPQHRPGGQATATVHGHIGVELSSRKLKAVSSVLTLPSGPLHSTPSPCQHLLPRPRSFQANVIIIFDSVNTTCIILSKHFVKKIQDNNVQVKIEKHINITYTNY